ncbi:carnosine N-methyltransferase [Geosmithia morbida]|uniref:Carnosine N-methyltransferase n=1 Tax=Geosmithia morbida TaxID=1094350 RepID=A0A9P4YYZ8_9HYPO|nr:carnosine N-methyltransferase [Geosmithia morbida]KAF4124346.1 carnosine N-methyltransferase [Geosmithia morbida]
MRILTLPSRFFALSLYILLPLYIAIRSSSSLSDIASTLSSLSERVEALREELSTSPLSASSSPASKNYEGFQIEPKPPKTVKAAPKGYTNKTRQPSLPDGLAHSIASFEQYRFVAEQVLQRKHARYARQTPWQKSLSDRLGYSSHFEKAREGIAVNAQLSERIAQISREHYRTGPQPLEGEEDADFGVVDLAFGHVSRDWSAQGAKEREAVFPPVLAELRRRIDPGGSRNKVLVPGSGLGRLASDIADLGYDVTANELDYGSILAHHLLTNHTTSLNQHTFHPFVTKWTYQANPTARYSALTVPDHWPNKSVKLIEGDFLTAFPQDGEFDAVVTLFFIDISDNVIDFLSNIHRLLKPGGVWINLGLTQFWSATKKT